MSRDLVFTREDGSQVLVTIWPEAIPSMAERPNSYGTWGPPTRAGFDSGDITTDVEAELIGKAKAPTSR